MHQHISKELKTAYPFASYKLLVDGKEVLYALEEDTWVRADKSKQIVIKKIIEGFLRK
ncbi:MAG: hypothetical protein WKG06_03265 [Segetibacter sp.]